MRSLVTVPGRGRWGEQELVDQIGRREKSDSVDWGHPAERSGLPHGPVCADRIPLFQYIAPEPQTRRTRESAR